MRLPSIVWREIFERKSQLVTSFLAILLGISVIVAVKNITHFSEKAVARELDALGANILILPKSASLQDYYSADMQDSEFPEEYVTRLATSDLQGLDNLSPRLSVPVTIAERRYTLTGILPKNEFQAKASWAGAGVFARPAQGCGTVETDGEAPAPPPQETAVRRQVIETLEGDEVLVGADVGQAQGLAAGASLVLFGQTFRVTAVLPQTGTIDDARIFAHLHTVQDLAGKEAVVNAIEVVGCCNEISKGLVDRINQLLPDAKVVTISQIVDTQIKTNQMMSRLSLLFLGIIALVGGASMANYMYANVFERRREIGTLMAIGAGSSLVLRLFLLKAMILGLVGGATGFVLGTLLAVMLGPRIAGVTVLPLVWLAPLAIAAAVVITVLASCLPALRAARLDPTAALQEG